MNQSSCTSHWLPTAFLCPTVSLKSLHPRPSTSQAESMVTNDITFSLFLGHFFQLRRRLPNVGEAVWKERIQAPSTSSSAPTLPCRRHPTKNKKNDHTSSPFPFPHLPFRLQFLATHDRTRLLPAPSPTTVLARIIPLPFSLHAAVRSILGQFSIRL
jgi:hypothetical protein